MTSISNKRRKVRRIYEHVSQKQVFILFLKDLSIKYHKHITRVHIIYSSIGTCIPVVLFEFLLKKKLFINYNSEIT